MLQNGVQQLSHNWVATAMRVMVLLVEVYCKEYEPGSLYEEMKSNSFLGDLLFLWGVERPMVSSEEAHPLF